MANEPADPTPSAPLRLLTVHAHPDDEASKGAALVARYREEGILSTLVTCTGGEAGEVLNPKLDRPEVWEHLAEVRRAELEASSSIIGFDRVDLLGYHDSGMPLTDVNARPDNFWNAPLDEATGRLVGIIRRDRPQVLITYPDIQDGYPHPDHVRTHQITTLAWVRAGDPAWYPESGEPWTPLKLYYSVWPKHRLEAIHRAFEERNLPSPFDEGWLSRPAQDYRITTRVDITGWYHVREKALLAHATQVDPESPFWFGLPREVSEQLYPTDEYILAASRVHTDLPEDDLFAGLR